MIHVVIELGKDHASFTADGFEIDEDLALNIIHGDEIVAYFPDKEFRYVYADQH